MKVLVIGAGAIGQVFARHFALGGATVHLLVRPRQEEEAKRGFVMYPLNRGARTRTTPVRLEGMTVHTDQDAALTEPYDLVVLAISSVALRSGDWLARLGASLGDAALLALQAGPDDAALIAQHIPPERTAWGMLAVISFQAPLPEQELPEPGIAYWFPLFSKLAFSGPDAIITPILRTLNAGGLPAKRVGSVPNEVAVAGPMLNKVIHALEVGGWSFQTLIRDPTLLSLAVQAMREAWATAAVTSGEKTPLGPRLLRPFMLRWTLRLAPYILPFDLEQFFHQHYVKVGEQTLLVADGHIAKAVANGVDPVASRELLSRIHAARGLEANS